MPDETPDVITPAPEITLAEYRAQREGKTPQPAAKPADTSEAPAEPESEGDSETPDEQDQQPEEKPVKGKGGFQKRIDRLTREREELRAKAEDLERRLAAQPAAKPEPEKPQGKPSVDQFETYDAYVEALADWKVEQKEQARAAKEAEQRAKTETETKLAAFREKAQAVRGKYEDFDEVLSDAPPITPAMQEVLFESPVGGELAYWLGTHADETRRIAGLSPVAQIRELARIELSLSTPEPKKPKPSAAPAPIKPVGTASAPQQYDPSKGPFDLRAYRAWRESGA